jgi:hypothetical protein
MAAPSSRWSSNWKPAPPARRRPDRSTGLYALALGRAATVSYQRRRARESSGIGIFNHKANNAPLLKTFLSRVDDMISHVAKSFKKS